MSSTHELTAYHGWAFDRHCWKPWEELLPGEYAVTAFDRGYFGASREVSFPGVGGGEEEGDGDGGLRIVMAHSFGAHLCSPEALARADAVILFGAFRSFHPRAARHRHRSRQVLKLMKQGFRDRPEEVLRQFMRNAYRPDEPPDLEWDDMQEDRILEDLHALGQSELAVDSLMEARKICIFNGSEDGIVAKARGRELYDRCREKASYFEINNAGHALPFTHAGRCWSLIRPEIEQLANDG